MEEARNAVWESLDRIAPDWTISGVEAHLSRSLVGVLAVEYDEDMGEVGYCQECADWFPPLMWNWNQVVREIAELRTDDMQWWDNDPYSHDVSE